MFRSFVLLLMAFLIASPLTVSAKEITKTFTAPKIKGVRLDWCKHWGRDCGAPAASLFCREKGYSKAVRFLFEPNLGSKEIPTLVFGDGKLCQAPNCSGFEAITCSKVVQDTQRTIQQVIPKTPKKPASNQIVGKPKKQKSNQIVGKPKKPAPKMKVTKINPNSSRFDYPKIKQVRVDWCRHENRKCGKPAANLFCLEVGFARTVKFGIDKNTGKSGIPTLFFGDGKICKGAKCRGFRQITCTRKPALTVKTVETITPEPEAPEPETPEPIESSTQSDLAVARPVPQANQFDVPVPSPRPKLAIRQPTAMVAIPKKVISFANFKPLSGKVIAANWIGTLQSLNTYPSGASLYKCSGGDCSISHSADFEVDPTTEFQSVQLNFNVSNVPHASGAIWQVSYLPFPSFTNGGDADLTPPGLLATEVINFKQSWFAFDLKNLFSGVPSSSGKAIFHVRILPIAGVDKQQVVGSPSNTMRIFYGVKLPPQDPYVFYTKEEIPGSRPDVRLVSLVFEPFKRVERWPTGCKTWEEKYGKKKNFIEKVGDFFSGAWDWTDGAYQWAKNRVLDVASTLTFELIPKNVLSFALDSALVSVGIPPDVPNLDQLMKDGVDGLAKEAAKTAVKQIPTADLAASVGNLAADVAINVAEDMAEDALRERLEKEIEKHTRQALLTAADEMKKEREKTGKKALCKTTYFDPVFHVKLQNMSNEHLKNVAVTVSAAGVHSGKTWNLDFKPGEKLSLLAVGSPMLPNGPYSHPLLLPGDRVKEDQARWWNDIVYKRNAEITVTLPGSIKCLGGDPASKFCDRETIIAHKSLPQPVTQPYRYER